MILSRNTRILGLLTVCMFMLGSVPFVSAKTLSSKLLQSYTKVATQSVKETTKPQKISACGDGILDVDGIDDIIGTFDDEQCDDGNIVDGDGCSAVCLTEVSACVEISEISIDINQDGLSDVGDIITARGIILGLDPVYNDGSCGDRFLPITTGGPVLGAEGVCCPEGVVCDVYCNGYLSVSDLIAMQSIILGTFQGDICGVEVCEEVVDEGSIIVESIALVDVSAQVCSENVDVLKFEVKNDGEVDIEIESFKVEIALTPESLDINEQISGLRLRTRTQFGYELLDEKDSSDIVDDVLVFDGFSSMLGEGEIVEFLVTIDGNEAAIVVDYSLSVELIGADVKTIGGISVCEINQIGCAQAQASRTISFTSNATIEVSVALDDPLVDHDKYVLAGEGINEVPFVAAFEVTAEFGAVDIEDVILNVYGDVEGLRNTVDEIVLYDDDLNVIASESGLEGSFDFISFDNINHIVEEGTSTLYVKISGKSIGDNQNGDRTDDIQFALKLENVDILDCDEANVGYDGNGETLSSHDFAIVPVTFANYEFVTVTPGQEYIVDTQITNGNQHVLAILEITASEWENTDITNGSDIGIIMNSIGFSNIPVTYISNRTMLRVGSTDVLEEIDSGEVVYYVLLGDVNVPAGIISEFSLSFNGDGEDTSIEYGVSDGTFVSSDMRLGIGSIDSPQIEMIGS